MNIAIFPNTERSLPRELAAQISHFLKTKEVRVFAEDQVAKEIQAMPLSRADLDSIDFMITLGGDGTILRVIHRHWQIQAPVLAINLGSLGFMADITVDKIYPSLQNLLDGEYRVQQRIMMEGKTSKNEICYAVNEMVIHRAHNPCLIDLAIYVDDIYLNTFSADGIIISTPSGSTAYSLAAGGPILTPELDALVITPISPHTISNRPIVLMPNKEIRIKYISEHEPVEITYDGFPRYKISTGEEFSIKRSTRTFQLVSMLDHDFFATLRTKLGWTGKLKV
jgi:NAD+ kinase